MVHARPTFLATLAALGLVAACTSNDDATGSSSSQLSFTLEGDGAGLALAGSPADAAYRAHYPLAGLTRMIVSVNGTGDLSARCEAATGPVKCHEMPFFSKVTRMGDNANYVTVYDIYGHAVIGTQCAPGSGNGSGGSGSGSGSGAGSGAGAGSCDGGACSGGGGGYGGGCTGTDCNGGGGSGSGSGGTATGGSGSGTGTGTGTGSGTGSGSGSGSGCTGSDCFGGGGGSGTATGSGSCSVDVNADCSGCSLTVGTTSCACSDVSCVSSAIASCAGATGGGSGSWTGGSGSGGGTGGGCTSGACGGDAGAGGGSAGGGGTGYGAGGGGATCTGDNVDKAKDQFCADIQTWLDQHNVPVTFDCSKVGDAHYAACMPPAQHEDYRCMDIVNSAWTKVRGELATCAPTEYVNWESSARWELLQKGACRGSPLVLDLAGDGVAASSLEEGVGFDLFGDGHKVKTAWVGKDDAFLAIDANGDGRIDGAKELFGNATFGHRYEDGFAALAELDANHDGRVDEKDPAYAELLLWRDANHDAVAQASELTKLRDAGVRWLSTSKVVDPSGWDTHGNDLSLQGEFGRSGGARGQLVDVYLRFSPKP